MDYYDLLGVSRQASDKDLKNAFKNKAREHHPDKGGDPEKFKQINEAYQNYPIQKRDKCMINLERLIRNKQDLTKEDKLFILPEMVSMEV